MANPKLDFFRFKLKHKSGANKTFREFMLESGKCTNRDSDSKIFGKLFEYFMNELKNDFAKNDSIKKVMTLISNKGRRIINNIGMNVRSLILQKISLQGLLMEVHTEKTES